MYYNNLRNLVFRFWKLSGSDSWAKSECYLDLIAICLDNRGVFSMASLLEINIDPDLSGDKIIIRIICLSVII